MTPKIIQRKWVKGECFEVEHDYLPGYIFLFAEKPLARYRELARVDNVYRLLGTDEEKCQLQGADLSFAMMLYACGGVIKQVRAYRDGDRVRLLEGEWGNAEGEILRTDRRGRALVQFTFDKAVHKLWIGYEMIEISE